MYTVENRDGVGEDGKDHGRDERIESAVVFKSTGNHVRNNAKEVERRHVSGD